MVMAATFLAHLLRVHLWDTWREPASKELHNMDAMFCLAQNDPVFLRVKLFQLPRNDELTKNNE